MCVPVGRKSWAHEFIDEMGRAIERCSGSRGRHLETISDAIPLTPILPVGEAIAESIDGSDG